MGEAAPLEPLPAPPPSLEVPKPGGYATEPQQKRPRILRAARYAIELCAGSARVSATMNEIGLRAIGIDWTCNRSQPEARCVLLDLTTDSGQQEAWRFITLPGVAFIFAGPPCGTASRARDRRVPRQLRERGAPDPKPLRSTTHPEGLPTLSGLDVIKVNKANAIYVFVAEVCAYAAKHGIMFAIENPYNSYFWLLPFVTQLLDLPFVHDVTFHSCMHGGARNKHTRFRVNFPECDSLNLLCDNQREHLPWGAQHDGKTWAFATADETVYPHILCHRLAQAVGLAMRRKEGAWPPPAQPPPEALDEPPRVQPLLQDGPEHREPDLRAAADVQARRRRGPQLINEFANVVTIEVTAPSDVSPSRQADPDDQPCGHRAPGGHPHRVQHPQTRNGE